MNKTLEMIQILFPDTKSIKEVSDLLDKYRSNFKVDTDLRLAMFLAQVREEVGSNFKSIRENLNYSESAVLSKFKNFTVDLAEKYARDEDTPIADQVAIANIAYAGKLGNNKEADSNKNGQLDYDDDGWKYRGAGCLQITGKNNFIEVQKRIDRYLPNSGIDIVNREDEDTLKGSILMGLGFWIWQDLYVQADSGEVDEVTAKINKYTDSYSKRKEHYNKIKHLI